MLNDLLYGGIRVISSPFAMVAEPIKKHTKTRSMSESYHARVQKKWTKRYGTKQVPGAYMTPMGLVAHPVVLEAMKRAI